MDEYQSLTRDMLNGTKREPSQDLPLNSHVDELATLGGKTRLVSPKVHSPSSSRGSKSPLATPQSTFQTSPPNTPLSRPTIFTDLGTGQIYQTQESPEYQNYSPEMALYGTAHLVPDPAPLHVQAQVQNQWQMDPAMTMGYVSEPMHADQGVPSMVQPPIDPQAGQYGLEDFDYMGAMRRAYATPQAYIPTAADAMSPQGVDLDGAWRNWMAQFGTT